MNAKLEWIFRRRSIRQYGRGTVTDDQLHDLLEAAMAAPSACAKDPWRFVTVRMPAALNKLADGLPNGQMLRQATVGIVVCGDVAAAHDRQLSYLLQDCSAAIENLLLAASVLGLGACWLGVHPREERIRHVREALAIPESILPVSVIAVGVPGEQKELRTRFKAEYVKNERYA
jgi:nitroreductase